eukprot:m.199910 g.199910  ORF g.199910 m.199910 type:complete len:120 (-) comp10661_c3_seq8:1608-1967(-)
MYLERCAKSSASKSQEPQGILLGDMVRWERKEESITLMLSLGSSTMQLLGAHWEWQAQPRCTQALVRHPHRHKAPHPLLEILRHIEQAVALAAPVRKLAMSAQLVVTSTAHLAVAMIHC